MLNNPLVTRAHFYTLLTGVCASCGNKQPGHLNGRAVLRHFVPNKGLHPLRRLRAYPSGLCSENGLLAQTISTAKFENSISSRRPSTENVGGLFASIFNRQEVKIMQEKEIEKLQAEKEKVERQLAQEQHKIQRLENRAAYYEKGDRRKRAHRLITRGAAIESVAPQTKELGETGFYALAEQVFALPDVQRLLTEAVSNYAGGD